MAVCMVVVSRVKGWVGEGAEPLGSRGMVLPRARLLGYTREG